jgi:hypothetical protein
MGYKNYSATNNKGSIYEKSKEPKEGFEEVITMNGKKVYQRKVKNIEGVIKSFQTKAMPNGAEILELSIFDGADYHNLSVALMTASNSYTREAEALISAMKGYKPNSKVSVAFTTKDSVYEGKTYTNGTFWINYLDEQDENGKNPTTGFISYTEIPKATTKKVGGKDVKVYDDRVEFFFNELQEISKKLQEAPKSDPTPSPSVPNGGNNPGKPEPKSTITPVEEDDDQDLPF